MAIDEDHDGTGDGAEDRMRENGIALFTVAMLLAGCATDLTVHGSLVREISSGFAAAADCHFMGVIEAVEGSGYDIGDDQRGAMNQIRNRAAEMGANSFVVSMNTSTGLRTTMQAEVYHCDDREGQPDLGTEASPQLI